MGTNIRVSMLTEVRYGLSILSQAAEPSSLPDSAPWGGERALFLGSRAQTVPSRCSLNQFSRFSIKHIRFQGGQVEWDSGGV